MFELIVPRLLPEELCTIESRVLCNTGEVDIKGGKATCERGDVIF